MRRKNHVRLPPRATVRRTAAAACAVVGYPSIGEAVRAPELLRVVRAAVRAAACVGLLGTASAAAGCATPECQASRLDEVTEHGKRALDDVGALQLRPALDQLGVGSGIVPHPAMPLGGAPRPVLVPVSVEPSSAGDTRGQADSTATLPPAAEGAPSTGPLSAAPPVRLHDARASAWHHTASSES